MARGSFICPFCRSLIQAIKYSSVSECSPGVSSSSVYFGNSNLKEHFMKVHLQECQGSHIWKVILNEDVPHTDKIVVL